MIKNLISRKEFTVLRKKNNLTGDELRLLQQEDFKEQKLQMNCKRIFDSFACQNNQFQYYFQQNDNGGYSNIATKKIKSAQGTISGWPDVTLWKFSKGVEKSIFIEFKRPKETTLRPNQQQVHAGLKNAGKAVYLCNNTIYFEKVICKEFFNNDKYI